MNSEELKKWHDEQERLWTDINRFKGFDLRIKEEFVFFGPHECDWVLLFTPIQSCEWREEKVYAKTKFGEYLIEPIEQEIETLSGIDIVALNEVFNFGKSDKWKGIE